MFTKLQCMKVKSESEVTQPCLTLSNPMDCSLPGSSVHGIFQARGLEWGDVGLHLLRRSYFLPLTKERRETVLYLPRKERAYRTQRPGALTSLLPLYTNL